MLKLQRLASRVHRLKHRRLWALPLAFITAATAYPANAAAANQLPLSLEQLLKFNDDFFRPHEGAPAGVPNGYDWYARPKRGSWNTVPANRSAMTGWGQAFWTNGTSVPTAYLLLKNQMTLVCHGRPHTWTLVQSAPPNGAEFRADFVGNAARQAIAAAGAIESDALSVLVPVGRAYHFWPKVDRAAIPADPLCGVLVLVQARAEPMSADSYAQQNLLLGLGADYWQSKTAPWDNYRTNSDIAIGRLKRVGTNWAWYGLSTASDDDLTLLYEQGYQN